MFTRAGPAARPARLLGSQEVVGGVKVEHERPVELEVGRPDARAAAACAAREPSPNRKGIVAGGATRRTFVPVRARSGTSATTARAATRAPPGAASATASSGASIAPADRAAATTRASSPPLTAGSRRDDEDRVGRGRLRPRERLAEALVEALAALLDAVRTELDGLAEDLRIGRDDGYRLHPGVLLARPPCERGGARRARAAPPRRAPRRGAPWRPPARAGDEGHDVGEGWWTARHGGDRRRGGGPQELRAPARGRPRSPQRQDRPGRVVGHDRREDDGLDAEGGDRRGLRRVRVVDEERVDEPAIVAGDARGARLAAQGDRHPVRRPSQRPSPDEGRDRRHPDAPAAGRLEEGPHPGHGEDRGHGDERVRRADDDRAGALDGSADLRVGRASRRRRTRSPDVGAWWRRTKYSWKGSQRPPSGRGSARLVRHGGDGRCDAQGALDVEADCGEAHPFPEATGPVDVEGQVAVAEGEPVGHAAASTADAPRLAGEAPARSRSASPARCTGRCHGPGRRGGRGTPGRRPC